MTCGAKTTCRLSAAPEKAEVPARIRGVRCALFEYLAVCLGIRALNRHLSLEGGTHENNARNVVLESGYVAPGIRCFSCGRCHRRSCSDASRCLAGIRFRPGDAPTGYRQWREHPITPGQAGQVHPAALAGHDRQPAIQPGGARDGLGPECGGQGHGSRPQGQGHRVQKRDRRVLHQSFRSEQGPGFSGRARRSPGADLGRSGAAAEQVTGHQHCQHPGQDTRRRKRVFARMRPALCECRESAVRPARGGRRHRAWRGRE